MLSVSFFFVTLKHILNIIFLNFKPMKKSLLLLLALLLSAPSFLLAQDCQTPENVKVKVVADDPNYGKKYQVILSWDAVEGAELYGIYFNNKNYTDMYLGATENNQYIMGTDVAGELFYLSVKTICDQANVIVSDMSEAIPVNILEDANKLLAPENLQATITSDTSVELTWDEADMASSYFVYRNGEEIANITETTYVDENLEQNTEYCYTVTSMGVTEESDPSEEV